MSYFEYKRVAEGYAKNRPQYHLLVIEMLKRELKMVKKLSNGLDVGCGAGLSSSALLKICEQVTGADASQEMIDVACQIPENKDITFIKCKAEDLRFPADTFDIVTVAGAINWVREEVFLPLVKTFLKNDGILLVYDNTISDKMVNVEAYTKWWHEQYLMHFPKPPRKENVWQQEDIEQYGFHFLNHVTYENQVEMTQTAFIDFMVTQSNVITKVEQQGEELEAVRKWFEQSLSDIFKGQSQKMIFEGYNWYIKKV